MATAAAGRVARDGSARFGHPCCMGDEAPVTTTSRAARRYARAVFELAQQDGDVDGWARRLAQLREIFEDPAVEALLSNPTIATESRQSVISETRGFDRETANLAKLLVEAGRIKDAAGIEQEFMALADAAAGRVRAVVTTAVALSAEDQDRVTRQLSQRLKQDVRLTPVVDPRILGGLKLQFGDRLIDATVATRLQQLRRRLATS